MVRGAEKLRRGRGREGVWRVRSGTELLEEDEEMTEAFLLSSARVGVAGCVVSGDGVVTWSLSIRGRRRAGQRNGRDSKGGGGRGEGKKLREGRALQ